MVDDLLKISPHVEGITNEQGWTTQFTQASYMMKLILNRHFMWEDDWRWLLEDNYIRKAFNVIWCDERIKQVTFRYWNCMHVVQGDIEYKMHVFNPIPFNTAGNWDIIKENDCTYGGLSMNPSLVHVPTVRECIKDIRQDSPENRGWDKIMSKKYWDMGYRRANLLDEYIYHIGNKISYYTRNK